MTLDAQRVYDALDTLQDKVEQILVHQTQQNGKVNRNLECIAIHEGRLDALDDVVANHSERISTLEASEAVEARWLTEWRSRADEGLDWSRDRIIDLLIRFLPWIGLLGLIGDRLMD